MSNLSKLMFSCVQKEKRVFDATGQLQSKGFCRMVDMHCMYIIITPLMQGD